ncbi:MAG: Hpt domain-containing protein [Candidatus Competibacteraceae bacterium]
MALPKKLLSLFRQAEADSMRQIRLALSAGDAVLAQRLAHTLKSVAGVIGADRLQATALMIEAAIRADRGVGEDLLMELNAAHAEVMTGLESLGLEEKTRALLPLGES